MCFPTPSGACCAWTVGVRDRRDDARGGAETYTFASTCDANGTVTVKGLYLVHPSDDAVQPILSEMESRMKECETTRLTLPGSPYPVWRIHCPRIDRECLDTDYSFAVVRTEVATGNKTVLVWPQKGQNYRRESDGDLCFDRKLLLTILVVVIVISAACVFVGLAIIYEKCHYRLEANDAKAARKAREEEMAKRNEPTDDGPPQGLRAMSTR